MIMASPGQMCRTGAGVEWSTALWIGYGAGPVLGWVTTTAIHATPRATTIVARISAYTFLVILTSMDRAYRVWQSEG